MHHFDYQRLADRTWPSSILNLIAKIHECKGRQEMYLRQKPIALDRLVEIAKIQSTESSNQIEGISTSSTRLQQLFQEKTTPRNRDESEIMGYRDVLNIIHESGQDIPIRPNYLLQLHRDLLKRTMRSYCGRFKTVQNFINEIRPDGTVFTRFIPVPPYETPEAIEALCTAYEQAISLECIDALILIPCFIVDFLCIHPFNDGNGRMSRLLTLLLLYQNGYLVGKYISLEKQIEKTKDLYYDALQQSDEGWHENTNDPTPFIRYLLSIILACYTEFEEVVGLMNPQDHPGDAYHRVKQYANEKLGRFNSADVLAHCPTLGRSSILAALKRLLDEGAIFRQGAGRNTCYIRADDSKK